MSRLEEKAKELGYKYIKRNDKFIKYQNHNFEIEIFNDFFTTELTGRVNVCGSVCDDESYNNCINLLTDIYNEMQKDLEILKESDN